MTTRGHVHYLVTEYGVVNLHGLSLRRRAEALISIAHPDVRGELRREAAPGNERATALDVVMMRVGPVSANR